MAFPHAFSLFTHGEEDESFANALGQVNGTAAPDRGRPARRGRLDAPEASQAGTCLRSSPGTLRGTCSHLQ
jgi:hypothetical protein